MLVLFAKYGQALTFEFTIQKRGSPDLAVTGDWTPATGDTKISKDGGNVANTTNNPAAVGGTGSATWTLTLTATEMQAARVFIQIVDSATKAVEDLPIMIHTYGNASALHEVDLDAASGQVSANVVAMAAGVVTASAIATGAIDADAIAADAVAEIADGVWDEPRSGHTTAGTFGRSAQIIRDGTAQAGAANTITLDASASASDDFYNNTLIAIVGGTGVGQSRSISDYVGSSKVATVSANWITNPDNTSVFIILNAAGGGGGATAAEVADAVWDEAISGHSTVGTFGQREQILRSGTSQGTSQPFQIILDAGASSTDDYYNGGYIILTAGTGAGQARLIYDYIGSTTTAYVDRNWITNPSTDTVFVVIPYGGALQANSIDSTQIVNSALTEVKFAAGCITAAKFDAGAINAAAIATDAITAAKIATDAITAAKIATDAIGASQVSSAAASKIADATWDDNRFPTGSVATDGTNSATSFKTDLASTTDNFYKDMGLVISSGTMNGQWKKVTAYNGTTKFITVSGGFTATPADGVTFILFNR